MRKGTVVIPTLAGKGRALLTEPLNTRIIQQSEVAAIAGTSRSHVTKNPKIHGIRSVTKW